MEGTPKVLGKWWPKSPGGGYVLEVLELSDEPGTLYAVLKTTSFAERWRMRIRLLFGGCKVKNCPKWATLDKYDVFSLLVGFDPDSEIQTRIVLDAAKLDDRR